MICWNPHKILATACQRELVGVGNIFLPLKRAVKNAVKASPAEGFDRNHMHICKGKGRRSHVRASQLPSAPSPTCLLCMLHCGRGPQTVRHNLAIRLSTEAACHFSLQFFYRMCLFQVSPQVMSQGCHWCPGKLCRFSTSNAEKQQVLQGTTTFYLVSLPLNLPPGNLCSHLSRAVMSVPPLKEQISPD